MERPTQFAAAKLAWWYLLAGIVFMAGTAGLAMRLIWEMTALSWSRGPQMIGFSLAHGHGPFFLLFFPPLLLVWLLIATGYLGWKFWRSRRIASPSLQAIISSATLFAILALPQGFWIRLFIGQFASGPHTADFMLNAAATGDLSTVKAFITHGVPVDARNREQKTALHGAAVAGDVTVIDFLVRQGAELNAISLWGDSPLENAISMGRGDAVKYLEAHGAVRIRGSEEHRARASKKIVSEDIERMDKQNPQLVLPATKP